MSDPAAYIESLIPLVPELGGHFETILRYYRSRLWHQLTQCVLTLVKEPLAHQKLELVGLYKNFLSTFEARLNQLTFVRIVTEISTQLPDEQRVAFLKEISELPKLVLNSEAFVASRSILAELTVYAGRLQEAKEVLVTAKATLDKTAGADASVYSNFFKAWATYYKRVGEPEEFYKSALQYVAYTQIDNIPKEELTNLAFDLGIAALLGEKIFNFGDLVCALPFLE
eukprot:TRINITY_DN3409_c0_g1_i15.p1 TRINITY_DN3409_c0_g1~~TRINITY_DN3409_c0_g1_i15.p1  ORF type:complete len:227 (-),score=43.04 TRINITY_DN3409_c0_g1_i15:893-1573(-)